MIVAKYLEEINFDGTFSVIRQWMESIGLKLIEYKTETVLITSRKQTETITLRVGDYELTSQPYIRCWEVMINLKLNFKQQAKHIDAKASVMGPIPAYAQRGRP